MYFQTEIVSFGTPLRQIARLREAQRRRGTRFGRLQWFRGPSEGSTFFDAGFLDKAGRGELFHPA